VAARALDREPATEGSAMMRACDWLDPELPPNAADLSERSRQRLLERARRDILQRTYTGTFVYPIFTVLFGWIVGLTTDYPRAVAMVASVLGLIVVVRVVLHRRAIGETARPSLAARAHLMLGVVSAAAFASAVGWGYIAREGDAAMTAGYVVMAGIAGTVVTIASTHRSLAKVWVLASIVPGLVVLTIQGGPGSHIMIAMYVMYLPILRKMIDKGHEAYWDAQVSAARLDEHAHDFARISRLAGMAENATNVLHDVGNTLNVVKTSTACLEAAQTGHPAGDLQRLVELLQPHRDELSQFFATDPRSSRIYPFLEALAGSSAAHTNAAAVEIARLQASVEHIELIIRRQQQIAGGVGDSEPCAVADLVAGALGLSSLAGAGAHVDVECSVDPGLQVAVDRHRALQILVNLLENAAEAVAGGNRAPRIRIRARMSAPGAVVVEIADNGSGIAADVVDRVFSRGFTTKPHGHGFGLHGSFVLAQAMGGELSFVSEGAGHGATFCLRLAAIAEPLAA
jgi:signal transduction histidine kinase